MLCSSKELSHVHEKLLKKTERSSIARMQKKLSDNYFLAVDGLIEYLSKLKHEEQGLSFELYNTCVCPYTVIPNFIIALILVS